MEFYKMIEEAFKEANSLEELYDIWLEVAEKSKDIFIDNTQYYASLSEFINQNTEFIKSITDMYRKSLGLPDTRNSKKKNFFEKV
ncbi:MAG: hypothetical protein BWK80_17640 [Desulfobacteraceae bacterium IS3]|nr:MAG: hypothetical protein BWK80_17640 [Desulfobacteraceae bacterium IS3]